jgi:hypothetical protein
MGMHVDATEEKDVKEADRAKRLAALFETEVWSLDILPILRSLYDSYLEEVKAKSKDPDVLKPLDDFVVRLGGSLQLGMGAMRRMAERRMKAAEKLAETSTKPQAQY